MLLDERVYELVAKYEELCQQGQNVTPEELCRDCQPLLPTLLDVLAKLRQVEDQVGSPPVLKEIPPTVEGYEDLEELDRGGMGVVYRGRDANLKRSLAIKVLLREHQGDPDMEQRFLEEAQLTAQLQHPGIPPVHEIGRLPDGRPFIAMKLVRGRTLADLLQQRRSPAEDLPRFIAIFAQVCQTLAYAHSRGVIHRDIKPGNVMVGAFGEVQVMDWGLAKLLRTMKELSAPLRETSHGSVVRTVRTTAPDAQSQVGAVIGTPAYMPPEQANGLVQILDTRADVFGLGAVLCEILTGLAPYVAPNSIDVLLLAATADLADAHARLEASGADAELVRLAKACLEAKGEDRPSDAGVMAEPVAAYQTGVEERRQKAELDLASAKVRVQEERKRRRLLVVVTAALIVAAGLAVSVLVVSEQGRRAVTAERDETEKERRKVATERDETEKQRQKAVVARDDARKMVELVSSEHVPQVEKQTELTSRQKDLFRALVGYYQRNVQEEATKEKERAHQASAFFRIGWMQQRLGYQQEAISAFRRAQELQQALTAEIPTKPAYRQDLARSHYNVGFLLAKLGEWPEAEREIRRAIDLQEKLAAESPGEPAYRLGLASSRHALGRLLNQLTKWAEAETEYLRARELLVKLSAEFPAVTEYREELANSHNDRGILLKEQGKWREAETEYRWAIDLRQKLVAEFPIGPGYRSALATSQANLGNLLVKLRRWDEAVTENRRARDSLKELAAEFPSVPEYCDHLAAQHYNLGEALKMQRKWREAGVEYRRARDLREKLAAEFPKVIHYRQRLAESYNSLGILHYLERQQQEAAAEYRRAIDLREKLTAEFPGVPDYALDLGGSYCNYGHLMRDNGQPGDSLDWYGKAIGKVQPVVTKEPRSVQARRFLLNAHLGRARALDRLDRYPEAVSDWHDAVKLDDQKSPTLRLGYAHALARTGQAAPAVAAVEELAKGKDVEGDMLYNCACIFALASAAAKDDTASQERYSARAVALLQQAMQKGFKDIDRLKKNTDLEVLRQRKDFQELLHQLTPGL